MMFGDGWIMGGRSHYYLHALKTRRRPPATKTASSALPSNFPFTTTAALRQCINTLFILCLIARTSFRSVTGLSHNKNMHCPLQPLNALRIHSLLSCSARNALATLSSLLMCAPSLRYAKVFARSRRLAHPLKCRSKAA
jgi:hypothetical protein